MCGHIGRSRLSDTIQTRYRDTRLMRLTRFRCPIGLGLDNVVYRPSRAAVQPKGKRMYDAVKDPLRNPESTTMTMLCDRR